MNKNHFGSFRNRASLTFEKTQHIKLNKSIFKLVLKLDKGSMLLLSREIKDSRES